MRISASAAAVLVLGGSMVLTTPTASASESCDQPLGVAGQYNEFIETDATRTPDSEGAVAIGGDAEFTGGFSIGSHIPSTDGLPGNAALVVGGTLTTGSANYTVLENGGAVYGQLSGRAVEVKPQSPARTAARGGSPVDFAGEFGKLRSLSAALAKEAARGTTALKADGGDTTLTLTGTDAKINTFSVTAGQLQGAKHITFDVPQGSSSVVNVSGTAYDMNAAGTYAIDGPSELQGHLLWNFPEATEVTKKSDMAWPGSVLAPAAAVDLGTGGPLEGTVIAKSLTAVGSAETHYFPFSGCLPRSAPPAEDNEQAPPPSSAPPAPEDSAAAPQPSPMGSESPAPAEDDLASTGGGAALPIAGAAAAVLAAGTAFLVVSRRRRATAQR
ncbi:choice-of-anchor A family protein [Streptomyces pathocidini]|uniref:choice-of-anchor A family protein n=1 Tax=Streptomyces pathocidini TaxID=1650571 RepID=UPI0033C6D1AD